CRTDFPKKRPRRRESAKFREGYLKVLRGTSRFRAFAVSLVSQLISKLRRQRLRGEIQAEHAAVEFFHVDQATGDFDGVADLLHAADREPANPLAAGTRLAG